MRSLGTAANSNLSCGPGEEAAATRLPAQSHTPGATRLWPARSALPPRHRHGRCPRAPPRPRRRAWGQTPLTGDRGQGMGGTQLEQRRRARSAKRGQTPAAASSPGN